jgi:hypothetical protein
MYSYDNITLNSSQNEKCFKVVEEIETRFVFNNFFPKMMSFRRMREGSVEPGRPQKTIRRMRIACWIPKATNKHSEHVILLAFPRQQWFHEITSVSCLNVYCLSYLFANY